MKILNALLMAVLFSGGAVAGEQKTVPAEDAWKTRVFTAEELKKYNGKEGMPAYVAVDGIVYDLSKSKVWSTGRHMMMHDAGTDQSFAIHNKAPKFIHKDGKILEKMPKVGVMASPDKERIAAVPQQPAVLTSTAPAAAPQRPAAITPKTSAAASQQAKASKSLLAMHKVTREEVGLETSCPVTGAKLKVSESTPAMDLKGKTYYFSSTAVMEKFGKEPGKYLKEKAKGLLKKK